MSKPASAADAIAKIPDNASLASAGFVGIDLESEILAQRSFRPAIAEDLRTIDLELFHE